MITIAEWLKVAEQELAEVGIGSAHLDALILMEVATGHSRENLLAHAQDELRGQAVTIYRSLVDQRKQRIPLVHLTHSREFYGLSFAITPDVLTPRAETEQMVDWAIAYAPKNSRLIDIGTGSGAIALAIARHRPDLDITATEISAKALRLAKSNANKLKLNTKFIQSDLFDNVSGAFSTVVTNLPYLKNDADLMPEVQREPKIALFGGNDGLELYRRFFGQMGAHLKPQGYVFTECDPWQQPELSREAAQYGLKIIEQGYFITGFQLK